MLEWATTNTMFEYKAVHKSTFHHDTPGHRLMNSLAIIRPVAVCLRHSSEKRTRAVSLLAPGCELGQVTREDAEHVWCIQTCG